MEPTRTRLHYIDAIMQRLYDANKNLNLQLRSFVNKICKDRDESHGFNHASEVVDLSLEILYNELENHPDNTHAPLYKYVLIGAWIHDVADHKYDEDGKIKHELSNFIRMILPTDWALMLSIIDNISFSKENKLVSSGNPMDFSILLGKFGKRVRDIISDADKLLALGEKGYDRAILYAKERYRKKYGKDISDEELKIDITNHSKEKLLRLKDEFIRTEYGKKLAVKAHEEFVNKLNKI